MLNFVENLLENERDPRSGPMNDQDHSLSLSDPDRSLVLSHFLTKFSIVSNSLYVQQFCSGTTYLCILECCVLEKQLLLNDFDIIYSMSPG
jgi:hypothetical protein